MTRQERLDYYRYQKGVTPYKGKERKFQQACAELLDLKGIFYSHIANEATYNRTRRREGLKKGVPDILIFEKGLNGKPSAIELKVSDNTPKNEQLEFMEKLEGQGWNAYWVRSMDEFIDFIESHYR